MTLSSLSPLAVAPWTSPLNDSQHSLIQYGHVVAGLALLAHFLRTVTTRQEISPRYRPAVIASLCLTFIAFLSYVVLTMGFHIGYRPKGGMWVPNADSALSWTPRYMDWSVTVPLLIVELIAVSALAGTVARRTRAIGMAAAFLMIFTGYLGGVVIDSGKNFGALLTWGLISTVFFVITDLVVLSTVLPSLRHMSAEPRASYRNAMILLLVIWFAYPIAYGFQGVTSGGAWTTTEQLIFSFADIIAKVGFGALIHKVAKLRTAEDLAEGLDTHPESTWTSNVKRADAVLPPNAGDRDERRAHATGRADRQKEPVGSRRAPRPSR